MNKLILVRHAERPDIPDDTVGNDILLTDKGENDAQYFAQKISYPVVSIQSSPVERCRQTANVIGDVVGIKYEDIILSRDLGEPGFIIDDGAVAWTHWKEKGHAKVNEYLLSGFEKWDGFSDLDLAVKMFDNKIRKQLLASRGGVHIWITHDTILATYVSRIMPSRLQISQWPKYLDYISVEVIGNDFIYTYFYNEAIN
ncbi:histidine phosphatase family protein [Cobetia sp. Ld8]|uniref:histidine phosphatase family protein n=1 Tax=Cobetia sp. Ld8 TaxID=649154 RepID=UPI003868142D